MTQDIDDRLHRIAVNLLAQTRAGAVSWRVTDREYAFLYSGSRASILIVQYTDQDGDPAYRMDILNQRGTAIETLDYEWDFDGTGHEPAPQNAVLKELWEESRRNALQIDDVLDGLLEEIKHPPKFSDEPPF
jgi:hypothetical protein